MSLPVNLNRSATATITAAAAIHPSSPKVYVACQNVAVQTEEMRCAELDEAEAVQDGDSYLKVFRNLKNGHAYEYLDDEQYWLRRYADQMFLDCDDVYGNISLWNREGAPKSVVWRNVETEIDYDNVSANKISRLWAGVVGVQTDPAQVPVDLLLSELFADGPIEWDSWQPSPPSPPSSPPSPFLE